MQKREIIAVKEDEKIRAIENKTNTISLDKAKVIAELEGLKTEFKEFEGVDLGMAEKSVLKALSKTNSDTISKLKF